MFGLRTRIFRTQGSYVPATVELQWHLSLGDLIIFTTFCTYGSWNFISFGRCFALFSNHWPVTRRVKELTKCPILLPGRKSHSLLFVLLHSFVLLEVWLLLSRHNHGSKLKCTRNHLKSQQTKMLYSEWIQQMKVDLQYDPTKYSLCSKILDIVLS